MSTLNTLKSLVTILTPGCLSNSNGFFIVLHKASIAPDYDLLLASAFFDLVPLLFVYVALNDAYETRSTSSYQIMPSYVFAKSANNNNSSLSYD